MTKAQNSTSIFFHDSEPDVVTSLDRHPLASVERDAPNTGFSVSASGDAGAVPLVERTVASNVPDLTDQLVVMDPGPSDSVYGGPVGNSGNVMLEGIIWGHKWDNTQPITYFFDDSAATGAAGAPSAWTTTEKAAYRAALQTWASVANITFVEVFTAAEANFIEQKYVASQDDLGVHDVPGGSQAIGAYNQNGYGWTPAGLQPGGLGFATLVHELGHALGLAHPHDNGGDSTIFPGVTSAFGDYGDNDLNQNIFTIMSYNHGYESLQGPLVEPYTFGDAATPMPFDIAAMQFIYGANTTTNNGATTYTLPITNAAGTAWKGIYDTGGIDQIVHNGTAAATISLQSATIDNSATGGGVPSFVSGIGGGFTIAQSAIIENATGGFGADTITGNASDNTITARDGADVVYASGGHDSVNGGSGADVIYGDWRIGGATGVGSGTGLVTSVGTSTTNAVNITNTFSLASDANIANSTVHQHTTGRYTTPTTGAVSGAYYALTVNAGTTIKLDIDATTGTLDTWIQIRDAAGNVVAQNDQSAGTDPGSNGDPNDSELSYVTSATGTYFLVVGEWDPPTNAFRNTLPNNVSYDLHVSVLPGADIGNSGTAGNDLLDGGTGSDSVDGGGGQDIIYLNDGLAGDYDTIDGGANRDGLNMAGLTNSVWFDMEYNPTGNNLFTANGFARVRGIESFTATAYNDVLRGNSDSNQIVGGDGNDQILGYSPYDPIFGLASLGDVMEGGAGNDTMFSGTGNDWMDGGSGDDQIEVGGGTDRVITGLGNDTIFISPRSGDDTIVDFTGGTGAGDVLRLYNFGAAFDTFAEVYAASSQVGAHTHIVLTDTRIILENFTRTNLVADDVLIV